MIRFLTMPLALACFCTMAMAQQSAPALDGKWTLKFNSPQGTPREGQVTIEGSAGTWQILASDRGNNCLGRVFPITISDVEPDSFTMSVNASTVLAGCPDNSYPLKRANATSFESAFKDGRKFVLQR